MKIAVTGANGLVGAEAVALLAPAHDVLAIGRGDPRLPAGSQRWASADLGRRGEVGPALRAFRPEAVLHCGAMTDVDRCEREPELAWAVNAGGTDEVARACAEVGARLVALSTDYVFDGDAGPYSEEDRPNPVSVYGLTKWEGEQAALGLAPDCAVARVAVVYTGRPGAKPTFATAVVERLRRGDTIPAFQDQLVSPTLARNAATMTVELLLEHRYRGVLHTAGAAVLDRVAFARAVANRFGLDDAGIQPVPLSAVKLPAPRPRHAGLRVDRAAALLRARPMGLRESLDAFHEEWSAREAP
jgi:dTDP-4-dehydrorhamnose reductase